MYKKEQELLDHYNHYDKAGITVGEIGVLRKTFDILEVNPSGKALDLGCGSGTACRLMKDHYDLTPLGVDFAEKRINLAKKRHPDIEFLCMDMHYFLDTTNLEFDLITLFDVIEHLEDPVTLIRKARSKLGTRGIIVARVPKNSVYIAHLQVYKGLDDLIVKLSPTVAKEAAGSLLALWRK